MADDSSQEKSEAPTGKKRDDARKDGTVAKSTEVNSVFVLLTAILMLRVLGPWIMDELEAFVVKSIMLCSHTDITMQALLELSQNALFMLVKIILPFAGSILFAGLLANIIQIGWLFTLKPLMPKLSKINPLSGLKRMFALRSIIETLKSILKISIIGYIAYITIRDEYAIIVTLADATVMTIWHTILTFTFDIFIRTAIILFVIAAADYGYQRYEHEKKLKMSHQEIKEERKQMDGDPQVKGRIRSLQREMARRRMMGEVPKASVVVTNPTHYAIALLYDPNKSDAPIVVAKGVDMIAQRIKKIAAENNVPLHENVALARAMYDKVEVGLPIPTEFYSAIAEVMAWVYSLKNKSAA